MSIVDLIAGVANKNFLADLDSDAMARGRKREASVAASVAASESIRSEPPTKRRRSVAEPETETPETPERGCRASSPLAQFSPVDSSSLVTDSLALAPTLALAPPAAPAPVPADGQFTRLLRRRCLDILRDFDDVALAEMEREDAALLGHVQTLLFSAGHIVRRTE